MDNTVKWTEEGRGGLRAWFDRPTLRGVAKTTANLDPARMSLATKDVWKALTRFAKIEVSFAHEVREIKYQWSDKEIQPLTQRIPELQDLPLMIAQWFSDIKRVARWEFLSEKTGPPTILYSGEQQGTTTTFQNSWYEEVEQLLPDSSFREIVLPELVMLGTQASLATNTILLDNLVGAHKQYKQANGKGDQIFRVIKEGRKVIVEGHQKFFIHSQENVELREGELWSKFSVEIGSPSMVVTLDKIVRYPKSFNAVE